MVGLKGFANGRATVLNTLEEVDRLPEMDRVLVVDCPAEVQLARLLARDGGDEAIARAILASQATREQRLAAAHDVIVNDGPPEQLPAAVQTLHELYREIAAEGDSGRPGLRLP